MFVALKLGKHKKLWNKGFDGIVFEHNHKSGVGVCRMHNLTAQKHEAVEQHVQRMCKGR